MISAGVNFSSSRKLHILHQIQFLTSGSQCCTMSTMKAKSTSGIRLTPEDRKLIAALQKKLGVAMVDLLRLGLRALASKEGVTT